jgi:hypothetical protein
MADITQKEKSFRRELVEQFITLSTSGFGLVAALAWNEAIQSFVKDYIQKYYPDQSGVFSKLTYAVIITVFAVLVTYQLSRLAARWGVKK